MEMINESRRYFTGKLNKDLRIDFQDVKAENGEIRFAKYRFNTWNECNEWMKDFEDNMEFMANAKLIKQVHIAKNKAIKITESEFEAVKGFMVNPDGFKQEDIRVYEAWLAHNFVDRDGERFSLPVLKSLNKTIVGKSLLYGHAWGQPGEGRFYKSRLEKISIDEAIELIGVHPNKNIKEHLQEIESRDGGIYFSVPSYYMLADNETEIRKIDAGITSDMSIGFRAPTRPEIKAEDGETVLWREYQNTKNEEAEAYEGSFVFLGSQYGARTRKDADGNVVIENDFIDLLADRLINKFINQEEKAWTAAYINTLEDNCFAYIESTGNKDDEGKTVPRNARHLPHHAKGNGASGTGGTVDLSHLRNGLARVNQVNPVTDTISAENLRAKAKAHLVAHAKKLGIGDYDSISEGEQKMELKIKVGGSEVVLSAETEDELAKQIQAKFDESISETGVANAAQKAAEDSLTEFKKALGDENITAAKAKEIAEEAKQFRIDLIGEVIKFGTLTEMIPKDKVDERRGIFEKLGITELKDRLADYQKIHDERNPSNGVLNETLGDEQLKNAEPSWDAYQAPVV